MTKFFYQCASVAAVSSALLLASCAEDDFSRDGSYASDHICFLTEKASWGNLADQTRAVGNSSDYVLRARGTKDTLCMKQIVTEGIQLANTPQTRGTVITDKNLDSFGVFAYTQQNGNKLYINNNLYERNADGIFESQNIYYWPGAQLTFDFYCYAPHNANGLELPSDASSKTLSYTVPSAIKEQQDIMLAVNEGVPGNNNQAVKLSYNHLLTAVNIKAGSQMIDGTVDSVKFIGFADRGQLKMDQSSNGWTLQPNGELREVVFEAAPNVKISKNGSQGTNLLGEGNTFLLLPQSMTTEVNSVYIRITGDDGKVRTYTTGLSGEWKMGTTNTYTVSLTPEYNLNFDPEEVIPEQDAHYVSFVTTIDANDIASGDQWTIKAQADDDAPVSVLLEDETNPVIKYANDGYWIDKFANNGTIDQTKSARGEATLSSSLNGKVKVRVFVPENATAGDRTITLSLYAPGNTETHVASKEIIQKSADWTDGVVGWEVIDDKDFGQWGFASTEVIVYVYDNQISGIGSALDKVFTLLMSLDSSLEQLQKDYSAGKYTEIGKCGLKVGRLYSSRYFKIDYGLLYSDTESFSIDGSNGLENTKKLYTAGGSLYNNTLIYGLENLWTIGGERLMVNRDDYTGWSRHLDGAPTNQADTDPSPYEVILGYVLKKNKCYLNTSKEGDIESTAPMYAANEITWFIPSVTQFANMPDWDGAAKTDLWSSNIGTAHGFAKLGDGTEVSRKSGHYVRVARDPQKQ